MECRHWVQKNKNYPATFEWTCRYNTSSYESLNKYYYSKFFPFCGFYCNLASSLDFKDSNFELSVSLKGHPAPHSKEVSCTYTIYVTNYHRYEYTFKRGTIRTSGERIDEFLCKSVFKERPPDNSLKICFSWCENKESGVSMQNVLNEPGTSTSLLESATQTEDSPFLHTANSTDVKERSTQTETKHLTSVGDTCNVEENKNIKFLVTLSKNLGSFYENKTDPDCVLIVGETSFPVHRALIAARSTVFAAMFHHDTSESQSGEVNVMDVNAAAFGDVIYYMYTGNIRGLSSDTAVEMCIAADKYALFELREECLNFLMNNLTAENVCNAAVLAHTHAEEQLENKVVQFIKVRLRELMETETWKHFSLAHSLLANKLLCSALIAS